jgi:hypothetical protein
MDRLYQSARMSERPKTSHFGPESQPAGPLGKGCIGATPVEQRSGAIGRLAPPITAVLAIIRADLDFIMAQQARLPPRKELWRATLAGIVTWSGLTIVLALVFWH